MPEHVQPDPAPFFCSPILMPKVWGGRRLARWGKTLPEGVQVGESWEVADLTSTSPTGGGGQGVHSTIGSGPLHGATLHDAVAVWGARLLGTTPPGPGGAFPLLVKYLDAREHLSVQVHPSPEYARAHPEAHLKTETWYVLDAEEIDGTSPVIFKGLLPGVGEADLRRHIEQGTVPQVLRAVPAVPGSCHTLPSGTIHALGAGVLVAEVQTPSDTTFRVYDWAREYGRTGRSLHIEESLACICYDQPPEATVCPPGGASCRLAETPYFAIDERIGAASLSGGRDAAAVLMVIDGHGALAGNPSMALKRGDTVIVPAACGCAWQGDVRVLVVRVG
ncbi:MAG: class I mannose-6-phosphate isomerase [Phycisphaeraceae bacterium]|nr:class I mannose-6-phosphate isomerase [Phycisphaeraceae bacterium]MCW5753870.1 class I mannose-6-phosphate isomerase [Phycisphaeraceae bacterium]